jgi:RHS repeat-associated protein
MTQTFGVDDANRLTTAGRSGTLTAAGAANSLATSITVNGQSTELYTDKTFATTTGLTLNNGTNILAFTATDNASHSTTVTQVFHLPATVSYAYDLNGNLTSDGDLGYDYDDADQLVRLTKTNEWKSEFGYDALGRRSLRREYHWSPETGDWALANETRYVWFGMSVLQERDGANQVRVTYTGRLAREDAALGATSYYFTDGNGNVSSLINASGSVQAKYRYDSFGNLLGKSGALADVNLIRFSGKEYHNRSGLYYYGFRYYAPNLQRWLNQDPIEERGGINLFMMGRNNVVGRIDPFGLDLFSGPPSFQEWDFGDIGDFCLDKRNELTDAFRDFALIKPLDNLNDEFNRSLNNLKEWANPFNWSTDRPSSIALGLGIDIAGLGLGALYVSEQLDAGKKIKIGGKIWENDDKTWKCEAKCWFQPRPGKDDCGVQVKITRKFW